MERLTSKYGKGHKAEMANKSKIIEKLGEYEDLEEQGLLLRLPCKIYDRIYRIVDEYEKRECFGCDGCTDEFVGKTTKCDYFVNSECTNIVSEKDRYSIVRKSFKYEYIPMFGKTVFLTQEEAEQALAKMNGGEHDVK